MLNTLPKLRPKHALTLCLLLLVAALQSGCYLAKDGKNVERRLLQVEQSQAAYTESIERTRDEITFLVRQAQNQVRELKQTLEEARDLLGQSSANIGVQVDRIENQLQQLQGRVDEQQQGHQELERALETFRIDVEFQLQNL